MGSAWWDAYKELRGLMAHLDRRVERLERTERNDMAQLADVQAQIDALVAEDGAVVSAINDLKARVDAGGNVTSADLDGIVSQLSGERDRLASAVAAVQPADGGGDTPVDPPLDPTPPADGGGTDVPPADTTPDAPVDSPPLDAGPTNV